MKRVLIVLVLTMCLSACTESSGETAPNSGNLLMASGEWVGSQQELSISASHVPSYGDVVLYVTDEFTAESLSFGVATIPGDPGTWTAWFQGDITYPSVGRVRIDFGGGLFVIDGRLTGSNVQGSYRWIAGFQQNAPILMEGTVTLWR